MSEKPKVAIQGEPGSFSEEAALKLLGDKVEILGFRHFEEVFESISEERADFCLVPIENSLTGSIHRNYDLLRRHRLKIGRELYLRIVHNLIALPGVKFEEVETVISHPVALSQCEQFFERFPKLQMKPSYDTSGSVKEIFDMGIRTTAAIAGRRASEVFGGDILMESVQDNEANYTRFVLLSPELTNAEGSNKTSIVFSFKSVPGALFKSLSVFALRDIDLTKIESRPIHGRPWEYLFYVDFLGSIEDESVQNALNHLQEITDVFEVLGCYPRDASVAKRGM
ncbi:MAG: prephenate dehydratase [Acidobacteriota bacterium]|nr:MAG: prephenate dehydratase [Acidobacteriota bacterium]